MGTSQEFPQPDLGDPRSPAERWRAGCVTFDSTVVMLELEGVMEPFRAVFYMLKMEMTCRVWG